MFHRYLVFIVPFFVTSACYLEAGSCSGPLCFSVATEIGDEDCIGNDCAALFRCPDADSVRSISLNALNQARQSARLLMSRSDTTDSVILNSCGDDSSMPASVVWDETLFSVADRHARDMAANNFVALPGSDGIGVAANVAAQDSSLSNVSQLVAAGFASTGALINEWLRQSEECGKLLDTEITQFAMACRYDRNSDFGTYWSLVLATDTDADQ